MVPILPNAPNISHEKESCVSFIGIHGVWPVNVWYWMETQYCPFQGLSISFLHNPYIVFTINKAIFCSLIGADYCQIILNFRKLKSTGMVWLHMIYNQSIFLDQHHFFLSFYKGFQVLVPTNYTINYCSLFSLNYIELRVTPLRAPKFPQIVYQHS